jgi:hypothetical protein
LTEEAIARGLFSLKTPRRRSSASLVSITRFDHFFFAFLFGMRRRWHRQTSCTNPT